MEKPPCKPDCPKRSVTCHGSCPDYAAYDARNQARRDAKAKHMEENYDLAAERQATLRRWDHGRRRP